MIIKEACDQRKLSHMALISYFISIMFDYKIKFYIKHIPGTLNIEADNLSRFKKQPLQRLYQTPRPSDKHTAPFYTCNPDFNNQFKFEKLNLLQHTYMCLNTINNL